MTECKPETRSWWLKLVKIAKWFAVIGGIFTLLDGAIWHKMLGYEQEDVIKVALLCTIYIVFLIIKFIHKGKIKFFWKAFPNVFIVIFLYHLFTISTAILTFLYDPLAGCYVAPNLTKEKIMSLKTGDNRNAVIKSLGYPIQVISPYEEAKKIQDRDPGKNWAEYSDRYKKLIKSVYTYKGIFNAGFEFNVYFIDDKVTSVVIKRNFGDYVYRCGKDNCPEVIDQHSFDEFFELSKKSNH